MSCNCGPGYQAFLNALVATSWESFEDDIAVKLRDGIKLHQVR